ncbi:MAG: pectate lyase [Bryobacteraceae bacterium]
MFKQRLSTLMLCTAGIAAAQGLSRDEALAAMKRAAAFYAGKVATHGGYHYYYAEDLSYGRSEHGEGLTQIEVQRDATPMAGMAFLEAFDATGDRFYLDAASNAAHALVAGQLCSGGWDYLVEFDPALRKKYPYRKEYDCASASLPAAPPTTLDDNVTQAATRLLMRVDKALDFKDAAIHEAARYALDHLISAQYPNGAWPQRYTKFPDAARHPVKKASYPESWSRKWPGEIYKEYYTFNDNSISDDIDMMLEAARIYGERRYLDSALKGGGFMLLAQLPEPQPAWAQQYDADMHPAWARLFEPPSVTGGESQGIIRTLMLLYRETGDRKFLDPVGGALGWLEKSVLPPAANPSEHRRRLRGAPALARFYELKTNRPLYVTKGTQIRAAKLGSARIDGYELSYDDASVITHYGVLVSGADLPEIRREYERVRAADPKSLRRPDKLHGLSPWQSGDAAPIDRKVAGDAVKKIATSMDDRGAWLEEGSIGRADRVISVFAARPMLLTINGRPIEINENDDIVLYQGTTPPRANIIRTSTFARNLLTLAAFVKGSR